MPRKARKRAHHQGTVHQRGPRNWAVRWRENGRRRYSGGYETRELAEQVRAKIVADLAAGRAGLPADPKGTPTLGELAATWLERRQVTHRSVGDDASNWKNPLGPAFGKLHPPEVTTAGLRRFIERKLAEGLNPSSVRNYVRQLSSLFSELVEEGHVMANPVKSLPRATRRLYKPTNDPKRTPFLQTLADVRRVYRALPEPISVAFAIGALGGLRTGEVLGLAWADVDLDARRFNVHQQVQDGELLGTLKDDDSRIVPIQDSLIPILKAWRLNTGGQGIVCAPRHPTRGGRPGSPAAFIRPHTLARHLKRALAAAKLPTLTWYQATRHSFASLWVSQGGSIEELSQIMGHSSVLVTERYAHLRPDLFRDEHHSLLTVDLTTPGGDVVCLPTSGAFGYSMGTRTRRRPARRRLTIGN